MYLVSNKYITIDKLIEQISTKEHIKSKFERIEHQILPPSVLDSLRLVYWDFVLRGNTTGQESTSNSPIILASYFHRGKTFSDDSVVEEL